MSCFTKSRAVRTFAALWATWDSDSFIALKTALRAMVMHALNIGQDKMREITTLTDHEIAAAHAWAHSRAVELGRKGGLIGGRIGGLIGGRIGGLATVASHGPQLSTAVQGANNGKWKGALAKAKSIQSRKYRAAAKARVAKAHAHARATA